MHIPVLLQEVLKGLDVQPADVFLDGTINGGGHSRAVAELLGNEGVLIGTDLDVAALEKAKVKLAGVRPKVFLKEQSFRNLDKTLAEAGVERVDKILLDLGLSSNQFEESGRGFSFQKDETLLMTFKNSPTLQDLTAERIVNEWAEENLRTVIESYGEERWAKRIAAAIVTARQQKPIRTTTELVEIIEHAVPASYKHRKLHPATKTFQALRITVNDEIEALKEGLRKGFEALRAGGRLAVISFHSLEDRIVKRFFREMAAEGKGRVVTRRPITPSDNEISENPRARSAKLRIIERS